MPKPQGGPFGEKLCFGGSNIFPQGADTILKFVRQGNFLPEIMTFYITPIRPNAKLGEGCPGGSAINAKMKRPKLSWLLCGLNLLFGLLAAADIRAYTTQQDAALVLGQQDMTSSNNGTTSQKLAWPRGLISDSARLLINDGSNNRILIFNTIPASGFAAGDLVIGQPDMTSGDQNQGLANCAANTLMNNDDVWMTGGKIIIADGMNNRVLIYNTIPAANNANADVIIGQPDGNSSSVNFGDLSARSLNMPMGICSDGARLFIADTHNHRVLIFNTIPTSDFAPADLVLGQPDMTSNTPNNGGRSAKSLFWPRKVHTDNTRLIITDYGNHRVLIFNTIPTSNFALADVVAGQPDMTSGTANNGGVGANTLNAPVSACAFGANFIVADFSNHRVLVFNTIPISNHASADVVLGQPDFTSNIANHGGVSAHSLNYPWGIYSADEKLWVSDRNNNRVLRFDDGTPTCTPTVTLTCTATPTPSPPGISATAAMTYTASPPFVGQAGLQAHPALVRPGRGGTVSLQMRILQAGKVRLQIYDLTGRRIVTLVDENLSPGTHSFVWNGEGAGSGTYLVIAEAGGQIFRRKVVLIR